MGLDRCPKLVWSGLPTTLSGVDLKSGVVRLNRHQAHGDKSREPPTTRSMRPHTLYGFDRRQLLDKLRPVICIPAATQVPWFSRQLCSVPVYAFFFSHYSDSRRSSFMHKRLR